MATSSSDDFSVFVLASDLGIDARPFLTNKEREQNQENPEPENWHDCCQDFISDEDFSDLDLLQFFTLQGSDKSGNRVFRIVGKYFPGNDNKDAVCLTLLKSLFIFLVLSAYLWVFGDF